jgi:hypothetical protein
MIGAATRAANVAIACFTQWRQGRARGSAVSQAELNEAYKGPTFDLAVRYGQHMQARHPARPVWHSNFVRPPPGQMFEGCPGCSSMH